MVKKSALGALTILAVGMVALVASSHFKAQPLLLQQDAMDGMAIGSGSMPLSMDSDSPAPYAATTNPFVAAMESTVTAARSLRQQMGGPSMRVSAGRAQLHQLSANARKTDTEQAAQALKNYMAQEASLEAQAPQQLAAAQSEPEVSGMSLGSGGRPLPMHLDVPAVSQKQRKRHDAKMLALFDKLSPETQQLLVHAQPGLSLGEASAAVESHIRSGKAPDDVMPPALRCCGMHRKPRLTIQWSAWARLPRSTR